MFTVIFRMLRGLHEVAPKSALHKIMRKQLYLQNKILKLEVLKWITILSIHGLTLAAKNENCDVIYNGDSLRLNPEHYIRFLSQRLLDDALDRAISFYHVP